MADERTDGELLRACGHDPEAFRVLYQRWAEELLRFFQRRTGDAETSLELTAETFAIVYERRERYQERRGSFAGWLYGIGRHELQRFRRRARTEFRAVRRLKVAVPALDELSSDRIDELLDVERFRSQLHDALGRLSVKEREAVRLRVLDQLDYRAVATRLDCSEQAARVRVHRGLARLATSLEVAP